MNKHKFTYNKSGVNIAAADKFVKFISNISKKNKENKRFKKLWLASETVDLGGATISSDGSGNISISADGVTLPTGSKDAEGYILARTISEASGATFKYVKLYTQASGLSTAATSFKFNARKSNTAVYTDAGHIFTLSNGDARSDSAVDLFQF